jgi:hypothetical protein
MPNIIDDTKGAVATPSAKSLVLQSRLHASLGIIGLLYAAVLIYPKAVAILAGNTHVLGVGTVANLALAFGSLMFLRNARYFRARASTTTPPPHVR